MKTNLLRDPMPVVFDDRPPAKLVRRTLVPPPKLLSFIALIKQLQDRLNGFSSFFSAFGVREWLAVWFNGREKKDEDLDITSLPKFEMELTIVTPLNTSEHFFFFVYTKF